MSMEVAERTERGGRAVPRGWLILHNMGTPCQPIRFNRMAVEVVTGFGEGGLKMVAKEAIVHACGIGEQRASRDRKKEMVASQLGLTGERGASLTRVRRRRVVSWPRVKMKGQGGLGREK